jgi:hypothetical protein
MESVAAPVPHCFVWSTPRHQSPVSDVNKPHFEKELKRWVDQRRFRDVTAEQVDMYMREVRITVGLMMWILLTR